MDLAGITNFDTVAAARLAAVMPPARIA